MQRLQKGFGLVEIMVGLVVGMISMLVVLQVFQNAEARKRTTTAGADAQSNGAIALYMIERDTRMAGWGLPPGVPASCQQTYTYCDGSPACGGTEGPLAGLHFTPLRVIDGGTGPDSIAVQYFSDPEQGSFRLPANTVLSKAKPQGSSELDVSNPSICEAGNMALLRQAGNCTLTVITHVQEQARKLQHNPGREGIYNPPMSYQRDHHWPAYTKGAELTCFKASASAPVHSKVYSVERATRRLERSDNSGAPELVMADIVDLKAQYGIALPGTQHIDSWVDASAAPWIAPGPNDWRLIKAVRVAIVARSSQYEREKDGAGACKTTTADTVATWPRWAGFSTTGYPADWGCYRYRVFETVIPLRNVIWGNL